MSRWTHRICADCYIDSELDLAEHPARTIPEKTPSKEPCCFCGVIIINVLEHGGIYIRHDPATLECTHE